MAQVEGNIFVRAISLWKVMCQTAGRTSEGWLREEDIDNFPCEDLRILNQL
ncbi:GUN4 domain-containing protein [Hydrococcus rivularis]|uniref:GUN4 domain-containing protein n=1 Tax=Hydrococcus rivularis TaxID=1616834 RepID=UPI000AEDB2CC|nr:GUN4 domain-containing protein [Hydrococcus rivularis]